MTQQSAPTPPGESTEDFELNITDLMALADHLTSLAKTGPEHYKQNVWGTDLVQRLLEKRHQNLTPQVDWPPGDCGTTACLAGWTVAILGDTQDFNLYEEMHDEAFVLMEYAQDLLGLSSRQSDHLFTDMPYSDRLPTAWEAGLVIRHLANTGTIDWQAGRPKEPGVALSPPYTQ